MKDYTLSREKSFDSEQFHRSLRDKRQADRVKAVIAHIGKQYGVCYSANGVTESAASPWIFLRKTDVVPRQTTGKSKVPK
jgi:hypothetical protein